MIEYLKDLLFSGNEASRMFNSGYISGVGTALGIIVVLLIVKIIIAIVYRQKKSNGITIKAELGDIFISTSAITVAIRALENEFNALVIQKIRLFQSKHEKVTISIQLIYDEKGGNFKTYSENFQKRVIAKLKETFGVENIDKVDIDNNTFNSEHKPHKRTFEVDATSSVVIGDTDSDVLEFQPQSGK